MDMTLRERLELILQSVFYDLARFIMKKQAKVQNIDLDNLSIDDARRLVEALVLIIEDLYGRDVARKVGHDLRVACGEEAFRQGK